MATVNSLENIATSLRATSGTTSNETVEVLGYYNPNDGGGGTFYWDSSSTATDNGGTIIQVTGVSTGRWMRVYGNFINVKWFGAKADGSDDTAAIQDAIDYAIANNLNVYISNGEYHIYDTIVVDLTTAWSSIILYGDRAGGSSLLFIEPSGPVSSEALIVTGNTNTPLSIIKDFQINKNTASKYGVGLKLDHMYEFTVSNVFIQGYDVGMQLTDVNRAYFESMEFYGNNIGITGTYGDTTYPNVLNFISCRINGCVYGAVQIANLHSVIFDSCAFEGNGSSGGFGAIDCSFNGVNGANGINVSNCYFEANYGTADICITNTGYGSHTFKGNIFNRAGATVFTTNNIFIIGDGQDPQTSLVGAKCKLTIIGNGFFAYNSTGSGYTPSYLQKAIQLQDNSGNDNYWQFDVIESENEYTYVQPAPDPQTYDVVSAPSFDKRTPQVSEYTRVKAFCRTDAEGGTYGHEYNISSVAYNGTGDYTFNFANPLNKIPVVTAMAVGSVAVPFITNETYTSVSIVTSDLSGNRVDCALSIHVF